MINESTDAKDFFFELIRRGDGRIFLMATILCLIFLCINIVEKVDFFNHNPYQHGKWIALWAMLPLILLFIHIRLRQLIETENILVIFVHALIQFGVVFLLFLKNGGVL